MGLTRETLEELTYIEAQKTLYSFLDKEPSENVRKATQKDIDRLLA